MIEVTRSGGTTPRTDGTPPREPEPFPPLENGERLHASEFLGRYAAMPDVKKAELIQGIVYLMASPVSLEHGEPDSLLQTVLGVYSVNTRRVRSAINATVKLSPDDVVQPDGLLRILPGCGASAEVKDSILHGAPELGFEIAASSGSIDANAKKTSYRRAGMQEYLLWRTRESKIDWWRLIDDDYQCIEPGEDGIRRSSVFPGLWLDTQAMLGGDGVRVLEILNQGLASAEHADFVRKLAGTASV